MCAFLPPARWRTCIRVYWEDTDAGGVVFYANYLKFFERARTEWLRAHIGIAQQALRDETGGMFVVTDTQVKLPAARPGWTTCSIVTVQVTRSRARDTARLPPAGLARCRAAGRRQHPHRLRRRGNLAPAPHSHTDTLERLTMNQDLSITPARAARELRRAAGDGRPAGRRRWPAGPSSSASSSA
jgi:hypothetical protein